MKSTSKDNSAMIYNLQNVLMFLIFVICTNIPDSLTLKLPESLPIVFSEHTEVKISHVFHTPSHRTKRSSTALPEMLNLDFNISGNPINFSLKRNKHLPLDPVYISKNGVLAFNHGIKQINEAFYQDPSHTASVHLECSSKLATGKCNEYKIFASFITQGKHYILHSDWSTNFTGSHASNRCRLVQPSIDYKLQNDYVVADTTKVQRNIEAVKHRYKRQVTGNYVVELLMVTDYSVFKYWYESSNATTGEAKTADARHSIYAYFAFMLNGIDVRYQNLPGATYTLKVTYAGLQITEEVEEFIEYLSGGFKRQWRWTKVPAGILNPESRNDSTWTESLKSNGDLLSANSSLYAFSDWVIAKGSSLPGHDHAMLFTRYDLHSNFETGTVGYAILSTLCSSQSQSVVEEKFNFISQTIAAHELGHSLGAIHDGISNNCNQNDYFIMAPSGFALTGSKARHPWEFSSCTTNEIKTYIGRLFSNCMLVRSSKNDPNFLDTYLSPLIGQTYTLDQQCEKLSGPGSYICVDQYTDGDYDTICTGIWCSSTTVARLCTLYLPGDGTTCGNKKWCINGVCIASNNAPVADDSCVFGDVRGIAVNNLSCAEMIVSSPSFCYNAGIRASCCESCKTNYNPSNPNCLYGDHHSGCIKAYCPVYNLNQLLWCCGTCYDGTTTARTATTTPTTMTTTPSPTTTTTTPSPTTTTRTVASGVSTPAVVPTTPVSVSSTAPVSTISRNDCPYGDHTYGCIKAYCPFYNQNRLLLCCGTCYEGTTAARKTPTTATTTQSTTSTTPTSTTTTSSPTTTLTTTTTTPSTTTTTTLTTTTTTPSPTTTTVSITDITTVSTISITDTQAWMIPLIASVAGIGIVLFIIIAIVCVYMSRRSGKNKPTTSSVRSRRNITNHGLPYVLPEANGNVVLHASPPGGFSYTAHINANSHVNQPVSKPVKPKIPLKPPPYKRPIVSNGPNSTDRGTSVRSTPPKQPHGYVEIVPNKSYKFDKGQQGQSYVNYGYTQDC